MIPPLDQQAADSRGFLQDETERLWSEHLAWARARNLAVAGGAPWRSLLDAIVRKRQGIERQALRLEAEQAETGARRAREARARREANEAYAREAISLPDYLARLRSSPLESLTRAEQKLMRAKPPTTGQDIAYWLVATLSRPDAEDAPEGQPEVSSGVRLGIPRDDTDENVEPETLPF
jgi:hypothetical protein